MGFKGFYINENVSMERIPHLRGARLAQLRCFLSPGNIHASQKVDGFNCSFGVKDEKVFIKTKSGKCFHDVNDMKLLTEKLPYMKQFYRFHESLCKSNFKAVHGQLLKEFVPTYGDKAKSLVFFGELIGETRQNVIEYGKAYIGDGSTVLFGLKLDDGYGNGVDVTDTESGKKCMKMMCDAMSKDAGCSWRFHMVESVELDIDEYKMASLKDFLKSNDVALSSRRRDVESVHKKNVAKEKLSALLNDVYEDVLLKTKKVKPCLGGDHMEGVVLRNSSNGSMVKVVDVEKFMELSRNNWYGRDELGKLRKEYHIRLRNDILGSADSVIRSKVIAKVNEHLATINRSKFSTRAELISIIKDDIENEVTLRQPSKISFKTLRDIVKEYYSKLEGLNKVLKRNRFKDNAPIDIDNYKRNIDAVKSEAESVNGMFQQATDKFKNNTNFHDEVIWHTFGPSLQAELEMRYLER